VLAVHDQVGGLKMLSAEDLREFRAAGPPGKSGRLPNPKGISPYLLMLDPKEKAMPDDGKTPIPHGQQSPTTEHILQFFAYDHLPPAMQTISKPFCDLAYAIVIDDDPLARFVTTGGPLPRNPERTVALRKLLEAKDAAVRAFIAKS